MTSLHDRFYTLLLTIASPLNASLLYAVTFMLCNCAIGYVLYRRGWFLRV
jgi:hypothetical protein